MRKWTYLVAALLMAGATTTFTGCIDNDEPVGIENLRGAKAELLRAKVAVEAAEAARLNAVAEYQKALAAHEQANADFRKAEAKFQEAVAEKEAARTEEEKARIEKQIAEYKQEMENAALTHQATMVGLQQSLAEANRDYEVALKQIEIAKALMSESQKVTIASLETIVSTKKGAVDTAADDVFEAEKDLYEAMLDKAQGGADANQATWIPALELKLKREQGKLTAAEEALKKLQEFTAKDVTTTDWRKEVKTLEDSIEGLKLVIADYDVEITKLTNSDEYKAADKAATDAETALNGIATSAYKYTYKFNNDYAYGRAEFAVADKTPIKPEQTGGAEAAVKGELKAVNTQLALYTTERIAMLEETAKNGDKNLEAAKKDYTDGVDAWKKALEKYSKVGDYDQAKAKTEIAKAGTAYDNAITAAAGEAAKEKTARETYAKALSAYYTDADKYVGCITVEVELDLTLNGVSVGKEKRTVAKWLSDTSLAQVALAAMMKPTTNFGTTDFYTVGEAIKTLGDKTTLLSDLTTASNVAFGNGLLTEDLADKDNYMRVEPTETEVLAAMKANGNGPKTYGAAGVYYSLKQLIASGEPTNYKAVMADLQAAITSLTAKLDAMDKAVADAKADLKVKKDAFKVFTDKKDALDTAQGVISARKTAIENVKGTLVTAIDQNLGLGDDIHFTDTKAFEKALKDAVEAQEDNVITAQKAVAKAERNLKEAQEGKYDAVATAQKALDEATAELEAAQAEYEAALADLKTGLEIMAGTAKN